MTQEKLLIRSKLCPARSIEALRAIARGRDLGSITREVLALYEHLAATEHGY
jgi:hypothetical protein